MAKLISILLFTLALPAWGQAVAGCNEYLKAYTQWTIKIQGQFVPRTDFFEVPDWDPNSQFDGIVITAQHTRDIQKPALEIDFFARGARTRTKGEVFSRTNPMATDNTLAHFADFNPANFFTFSKAGEFEIRLKDGEKLLCKERRRYGLGH